MPLIFTRSLFGLFGIFGNIAADGFPLIGLGVAGSLDKDVGSTADAVSTWFFLGGRAIDTALMYENDEGVRAGISQSGVPRAEIFLTSKVPPERMGFELTLQAVEEAMRKLRTEYIDCMLIHWPGRTWAKRHSDPDCVTERGAEVADWTACRKSSWDALREARRRGWVRKIGVANYELSHLMEMESVPDVLQVEFHPWWRRDDLLAWCRERDVQIVAYSSLGGKDAASVMADPHMKHAATAMNASIAQVLLQWAVSQGVAVIPSSRSRNHMEENLHCCEGWRLPDSVSSVLSTLPSEVQYRTILPDPRFVFSAQATSIAESGPAPLESRHLNLFGAVERIRTTSTNSGCWARDGKLKPFPCCSPEFGPEGMDSCWNSAFTFLQCCAAPSERPQPISASVAEDVAPADFVVIGAGSGGSSAAAQLSESGATVVLLESGGWDDPGIYIEHPNPSAPQQSGRWFSHSIDWHLGKIVRRVQVINGRGLGGSSAVNGHVYTRDALPWPPDLIHSEYNEVEKLLTLRSDGAQGPLTNAETKIVKAFAYAGIRFGAHNMSVTPFALGPVLRSVGCRGKVGPSSAYYCGVASFNESAHGRMRVVTGAHAQRVIFRGNHAVGVEASITGRSVVVSARKGVLLAAGALHTPLILARSGIGQTADVARAGAPLLVENTHVGSHLQDHPYLPVEIQTNIPCSLDQQLQNLFSFLPAFPGDEQARTRTNNDVKNEVELQLSPRCQRPNTNASPVLSYKAYLILLHSRTPGRVATRSSDPWDPPAVIFNPFWGDGADAHALIDHVRGLYKVVLQSASRLAYKAVFVPPAEDFFDDLKAPKYCAQHLALWQHPSGTARLGDVVDETLAVKGVQALRIADASVLPDSVSGHPDAAIRVIGRLAAKYSL